MFIIELLPERKEKNPVAEIRSKFNGKLSKHFTTVWIIINSRNRMSDTWKDYLLLLLLILFEG